MHSLMQVVSFRSCSFVTFPLRTRRLYKSRRWLRAPVAARYMWCESLTTCSYTYLIYYAEVCRPLKTPPKLDGRAVVNKTVCMVQEWGGGGGDR